MHAAMKEMERCKVTTTMTMPMIRLAGQTQLCFGDEPENELCDSPDRWR
jgi:hypothetical protein